MLSRRLLPLATAIMVLTLPAPALAIVDGDVIADYADYPAQAFIGKNTNGTGPIDEYCTGTLVGSRQILTAARCATYGAGIELPEEGFKILIGDPETDQATAHTVADGGVDRHPDYDPDTGANDVAMLTLTQPVTLPDFEPMRVVDATETALWAPGTASRVLGWGEFSGDFLSEVLRKGDVTRFDDADCTDPDFDADLMLCAAGTDQNPCAGDSGSPLLVPDGGFFALAGVFSGDACATSAAPGLFARVGEGDLDPLDLNRWVHDRTPEADWNFVVDRQPQATVPFEIQSISRHPEGAGYFTTFRWDLNRDGVFGDKVGKRISVTIGSPGEAVIGLEASHPATATSPEGDTATIYYAFDVLDAPPGEQPASTPTGPTTTTTTPTTNPEVSAPLATILNARRPKVRRGRFPIRIRFARRAPAGIAVIEVYRGSRRIGIARTKVRRGATKRVRVKLTPTGRRMLRRADSKRLKIRVRVRVGRKLLRTKRLTIRR